MRKTVLLFTLLVLSMVKLSFAQTPRTLSDDEKLRIKLAVPLITYDTINVFDNAIGESYYNLMLSSFTENQVFPDFSFSPLTPKDKAVIESVKKALGVLLQNPPSWDDLLIRQTQFNLWKDKVFRRKSVYKGGSE